MPLEYVQPDDLLPMEERRQAGHDLRRLPRGEHAKWQPPTERPDPLQTLIEAGRHRISRCCRSATAGCGPRRSRSCAAPRRSWRPISLARRQAGCGCNLRRLPPGNFGVFAALNGTPVFDINDFDETLPAPFEWDLKRLATSFAVDARGRGMADRLPSSRASGPRRIACIWR